MEKTATLELTETQLKTLIHWMSSVQRQMDFIGSEYVTNQDRGVIGAITGKAYRAVDSLK